MITKRIIPCLDVKDGRVVKGTNFQGLRDMADPVEMAAAAMSPGSAMAPELTLTLSAPHFSTRSKSSSPRMPPPTVRGMKISEATRRWSSAWT